MTTIEHVVAWAVRDLCLTFLDWNNWQWDCKPFATPRRRQYPPELEKIGRMP